MQFGLWQKYSLTCDKFTYQAVTKTHIDLWHNHYKWLARWAFHFDTNVVGSSLTQVAFFLEKISNSILLLRLDYGLG